MRPCLHCIVSHPFRALLVGTLALHGLACEGSDPTEESVDAVGSGSGTGAGSAGQTATGSPAASTAGAGATGMSTVNTAPAATESSTAGGSSGPVSDVTSGVAPADPPGTSAPEVPTTGTPGTDAPGAGGAGGSAAVPENPAGAGGAPGAGGSSGDLPSQAGAGGAATEDQGAGGEAGDPGEGAGGLEGAGGATAEVPEVDPVSFAAGFHELMIHDACTADYPPQPDTCLHEQEHEQTFTFGGDDGVTYDVTLRVRGLFEPTTVAGGETPDAAHPYFRVGGNVTAVDYSQWHIVVSEPAQTYWLNHYPQTSHTIYAEDFEVTIPVAAGAEVAVRVVDGNDRQIDNAEEGLADRRQLIEGVTPEVLDGQVLRLDVIDVVAE